MAPIIPLRRIKTIVAAALAARFPSLERTPPKAQEFRAERPRPESKIAGRERDPLSGLQMGKFVHRARRHAKLRLFRVFKLFGDIKEVPAATYRPVAERLRVARWMLRL
jgi:hypothetical protein